MRDLLTTQHEQDAIRRVRMLCALAKHFVEQFVPTCTMSAPFWFVTSVCTSMQGKQQQGSLQRDAVLVDAVVSTVGFPLVGGPAGTMEGGRQADVVSGNPALHLLYCDLACHRLLCLINGGGMTRQIVLLHCYCDAL